ncbi:MAG: hypothetical protein RB294_11495 [Bacteroidales bacterium]|jgi:hypothetical protein|nr:hypothetical protein [Bacteroidales bacterium]
MTIAEIKAKYPEDTLFTVGADKELRKSVMGSLFDNLYENKIIYREKVAFIAEVESFELSEEYFSVNLKLLQHIRGDSVRDYNFAANFKANKIIRIKSKWENMGFKGNSLCSSGYNCWFIVFETGLVENTEKLIFDNESFKAADSVHEAIWPEVK